jgi:hypothetical protein
MFVLNKILLRSFLFYSSSFVIFLKSYHTERCFMSSELQDEYASILFAMRHRSVKSVEDYADEYRRRFDPASGTNSSGHAAGQAGATTSTDIQHLNEVTIQPIKELKLRDDILAAISVERRHRKRMAEMGGALCTFQPELSPKAQQHQHANKVWHERLHTDDVMKRELHAAERTHQRAAERQQADEDEVREMSRGPAAYATTNTFNRLYLSGRQHEKWVEREQQLQADLLAREIQKGQRSPHRNASSERPMRRQGSVFDNLYNEARQRQEQQQSEHDVATRHVDTPNRSVDLRRKNTVSPSRLAESAVHQRLYNEATERSHNLVQSQEEQRAKSLEGLFQPNLSRKESVIRGEPSLGREPSMRSNSFARREVVGVLPSPAKASEPKMVIELEGHFDKDVQFEEETPTTVAPAQHIQRDPSPVTVSPPRERQTLSPVIIASVTTLDVKMPSIARSLSATSTQRDLSNTRTPETLDGGVVQDTVKEHVTASSSGQPPRTVPQPSRVDSHPASIAVPVRSPTVAANGAATPILSAAKVSEGKSSKKSRSSERTPDEQAAHDQRKKERHERKEIERRAADAASSSTQPVKVTKTPPQRNLTPPPHHATSTHKKERTSPSSNAGGVRTPPPPVEKEDVFGTEQPSHDERERFVRQSIDLSGIAKASTTPKPSEETNSATPERASPLVSALDASSAGRTAESPSRAALALNRKQSRRMILEQIAVLDSDDDSSS